MKRLLDRKIIVTGAASGIGLGIARTFAREGARVALFDTNQNALAAVAQEIGDAARAHPVDITDESAVVSHVRAAAETFGGLDGLVNCAGVVGESRVADMELRLWNKLLAVNLTGTFLVTREALRWLPASGRGAILNISSNQGLKPDAGFAAYAASKAGMIAMTRALAAEVAPSVRVNCICPGTIDTPMSRAALPLNMPISNNVLHRMGSPEELAHAALFVISDEAGFLTGATIAVDGGRTFH